ncbi:MAG: DUF1385 domain-containing protein, partial [Clostridiales bacterium]
MAEIRYGGQAVIEGVMMAGPKGKAIACRNELGEIVFKIDQKKSLGERFPFLKLPILRGLVSFCSSMVTGIKDLTWSAAQVGESEDEQLGFGAIFLALISALLLCVVFFIALPVFVATWLHPYVGDFGRSLIEGVLRMSLFVGYVLMISRMEDIRRIFAYHGAEHKTINAFEAGAELIPEQVMMYSRIHTRCGTSFIFMAIILMIFIFTFVGQTAALPRILIKICLLPVVAGLSYELFRLPLKYPHNMLVKFLVAPGLAMQKITTREPSLDMLEVAIAALTAVPCFNQEEDAALVAEDDKQAPIAPVSEAASSLVKQAKNREEAYASAVEKWTQQIPLEEEPGIVASSWSAPQTPQNDGKIPPSESWGGDQPTNEREKKGERDKQAPSRGGKINDKIAVWREAAKAFCGRWGGKAKQTIFHGAAAVGAAWHQGITAVGHGACKVAAAVGPAWHKGITAVGHGACKIAAAVGPACHKVGNT